MAPPQIVNINYDGNDDPFSDAGSGFRMQYANRRSPSFGVVVDPQFLTL
jgi:hypothetical protein